MEHIWMLQFYLKEEEEEKMSEMMNAEQFSHAITLVRDKMKQAEKSGRSLDAGLLADLAFLHRLHGDGEHASSCYEKAIKTYQENGDNHGPIFAGLLQESAVFLMENGQNDQAITPLLLAEEIFKSHEIDESDPLSFSELQMDIGDYYLSKMAYQEAIDRYAFAKTILEESQEKECPLYIDVLNSLGEIYLQLKKNDTAIPFFLKALGIAKKTEPENVEQIRAIEINLEAAFSKVDDGVL